MVFSINESQYFTETDLFTVFENNAAINTGATDEGCSLKDILAINTTDFINFTSMSDKKQNLNETSAINNGSIDFINMVDEERSLNETHAIQTTNFIDFTEW